MRLPNTVSLDPAPDHQIRNRSYRLRTWQQTLIELAVVRHCAALAILKRAPEAWLSGQITVPVALPETSPALDTSDRGIPRLGSPQAVEKTAGKQAYSRPRQAAIRFLQTGQIGSVGVPAQLPGPEISITESKDIATPNKLDHFPAPPKAPPLDSGQLTANMKRDQRKSTARTTTERTCANAKQNGVRRLAAQESFTKGSYAFSARAALQHTPHRSLTRIPRVGPLPESSFSNASTHNLHTSRNHRIKSSYAQNEPQNTAKNSRNTHIHSPEAIVAFRERNEERNALGSVTIGAMDRDPSTHREEHLALLGRIVRSSYFANAESLRRILQYLADRTMEDETLTVKEYDIAVSAIRRPESFDPKLDPIVRVSMSSIRERLRAFFDNEGKTETWRLSIPKGQYRLNFMASSAIEGETTDGQASALRRFWAPHLSARTPSVLLYTEVLFYRDDRGNFMRSIYANDPSRPDEFQQRFPEAKEVEVTPSYHFLSAGEMHALLSITRAFGQMGAPLDQRNGRFFSWKDFQGVNAILLGSNRTSPFVKNLLSGMPLGMDEERIVNREPLPGDTTCWQGRRFREGLLERVEEYALITRRPGPSEGTMVTVISANHGRAIEAGGSFVSSEDGCREILNHLGGVRESEPFQVLLKVEMLDFDEEIVGVSYLTHRKQELADAAAI